MSHQIAKDKNFPELNCEFRSEKVIRIFAVK